MYNTDIDIKIYDYLYKTRHLHNAPTKNSIPNSGLNVFSIYVRRCQLDDWVFQSRGTSILIPRRGAQCGNLKGYVQSIHFFLNILKFKKKNQVISHLII